MGYYLGIDLGGTNIAVGVMDDTYRFVSEYHTPTLGERGFEAIIADMADAAVKALEKAGLTLQDIPYVESGFRAVSIRRLTGLSMPTICNGKMKM